MLEGRLLNERYKIKKMIGGGGMANVYLANDMILNRDVAIKVLRLEYANDEEFIARFHREAHSAISLSHPNIVNIYDVGEEENIYYMVMEYVDGMTLKKYIQTYGPVEVQESIEIMKQITSAIAHAHANDIVHRDIKPQNILIDPYGNVKVTDFGIAIALSATSLTQTNSVLGSVHYLSPEQARGGMANKKSDIYSLGIVLFELLTGRLPFSGQTAVSIALKHLQSNTPSIRRWNPELPQSIENIVLKATTKDPFHRYDTVYELEDALESALHPSNLNQEVFLPPEESGEATKAIPIITDETFKQHNSIQDTIVHSNNNGATMNGKEEKGEDKKGKKGKKKKKRKKVILWITVIFVALFGAILAALFILPNWLQPKDVDIPDVEGMEYDEAYDELTALNLIVEREEMYSEDIEEGHVVKTDPEPGMTVKEGKTVIVFSSQGKEKVTVGDYVGQDYNQVRQLLSQTGYKEVTRNDIHSDRPEGEIVGQVEPQQGSEVVPDETSVVFEVSIGPEQVVLNDVVGWTESAATNYLTDRNLSVDITEEYSEEVEEGKVVSQSPDAGSEVEEESRVELVISLGPEEKPPLTHEVKVRVPYTAEANGNDEGNNSEDVNPVEQEVRIYVGDIDYNISELYEQETITEDTEFTIRLNIPSNGSAEYRVVRDDQVVVQKTIRYEDVEDE
ncbi:Stk1 family PASTA domain-containing Ser/Thr kinase [Aquibacillus rhizosphaerae]|uniref:non-specific serine/threonine protein kinase n=1 Tax=Aquibacillus rhizosphaerae TaxID=3051431 RepID=A0ABT7L2D3_9BACI|nr:Stk1 family PASTA domain-containing Ser/Thr kinase [Aquibacillus sp. LR5S19]MDL4840015.1 Stk1 family PASTA domain-containing Ser/Thr kinase [Aquibacillus sp. LR5S19]